MTAAEAMDPAARIEVLERELVALETAVEFLADRNSILLMSVGYLMSALGFTHPRAQAIWEELYPEDIDLGEGRMARHCQGPDIDSVWRRPSRRWTDYGPRERLVSLAEQNGVKHSPPSHPRALSAGAVGCGGRAMNGQEVEAVVVPRDLLERVAQAQDFGCRMLDLAHRFAWLDIEAKDVVAELMGEEPAEVREVVIRAVGIELLVELRRVLGYVLEGHVDDSEQVAQARADMEAWRSRNGFGPLASESEADDCRAGFRAIAAIAKVFLHGASQEAVR